MRNEKGSVLVVCMMLLLMITLLAVAAMQTGSFGNRIAGNNLEGMRAFWIAEAGLQDAKEKLATSGSVTEFRGLPGLSNPVEYADGTYTITTEKDYLDAVNRVIVTSEGTRNGARKKVQSVMFKFYIDLPAALYSEARVRIVGKCDIDGGDGKYGIATTLPNTINLDGKPTETVTINAASAHVIGQGTEPSIEYTHRPDIPIVEYVSFLKHYASREPASKDWRSPSGGPIVVSLTGGAKLKGGYSGYGIILVEGDLIVDGGLDWNGLIIATGTITFLGGGPDVVNIVGGIISGESTPFGIDSSAFGGSMVLKYANMSSLFDKLRTVRTTAWREVKD